METQITPEIPEIAELAAEIRRIHELLHILLEEMEELNYQINRQFTPSPYNYTPYTE